MALEERKRFPQQEMSLHHKDILLNNRMFLMDNVMPTELFWSALLEKKVINEDILQEDIKNTQYKATQVSNLLHILPKRGAKAFENFCYALQKSGNEHASLVLMKMDDGGDILAADHRTCKGKIRELEKEVVRLKDTVKDYKDKLKQQEDRNIMLTSEKNYHKNEKQKLQKELDKMEYSLNKQNKFIRLYCDICQQFVDTLNDASYKNSLFTIIYKDIDYLSDESDKLDGKYVDILEKTELIVKIAERLTKKSKVVKFNRDSQCTIMDYQYYLELENKDSDEDKRLRDVETTAYHLLEHHEEEERLNKEAEEVKTNLEKLENKKQRAEERDNIAKVHEYESKIEDRQRHLTDVIQVNQVRNAKSAHGNRQKLKRLLAYREPDPKTPPSASLELSTPSPFEDPPQPIFKPNLRQSIVTQTSQTQRRLSYQDDSGEPTEVQKRLYRLPRKREVLKKPARQTYYHIHEDEEPQSREQKLLKQQGKNVGDAKIVNIGDDNDELSQQYERSRGRRNTRKHTKLKSYTGGHY